MVNMCTNGSNTQEQKQQTKKKKKILDASFGLLASASASALAPLFGSALSSCGVSCMA